MRIYDDRYERDRLRFHVALRFIRLEARTRTIRLWTGLSDDRIRKLYRSYLRDARGPALLRHRGKSPQRIALFLRSARARQEAALLASLCQLLGALPECCPSPERTCAEPPAGTRPVAAVAPAPSLRRAQLLCQAYESYRGLISQPLLGFEHAVFLLTSLLRADELVCGACENCQALLVLDRWSLQPPRCELCATEAREAAGLPVLAARSACPPGRASARLPGDDPRIELTRGRQLPAASRGGTDAP